MIPYLAFKALPSLVSDPKTPSSPASPFKVQLKCCLIGPRAGISAPSGLLHQCSSPPQPPAGCYRQC